LEKCLRIFRFGPIDETAAVDVASGGQLFFGALESLFLDDGLSDWSRQAASFKLSKRSAENSVGRAEPLKQSRGQTGSEAGSESQREPGEGRI
jgi:hypothetical protein